MTAGGASTDQVTDDDGHNGGMAEIPQRRGARTARLAALPLGFAGRATVGLGSLVAVYVTHQKTGRCLVLTGLKPRVQKIMEITKVNDFFVTFGTTWEAVEALANTGTA